MKTLVCKCGAPVEGCDDRATAVVCSLCVATGQIEVSKGKFQQGKWQRKWNKDYQERGRKYKRRREA